MTLAILAGAGPLAITSANRSGEPAASSCDELHAVFGDLVAVYLCEERPLDGSASTVVDLTDTQVRIIRDGGVGEEAITAALAG